MVNTTEDNMTIQEEIPSIIKLAGIISRSLPNLSWLKHKYMWFLMPLIRGKGYRLFIKYDEGQRIFLNLDDWIPVQMFWAGIYLAEKEETEYFRRLIKDGDIFLDVGANIGYYTLMAARRVGENGRVYAFEPAFDTYKFLKYNIKINKFDNILTYRLTVSDKSGYVNLNLGNKFNTGSSSVISIPPNFSGKIEKVACITLDEFAKKEGIGKVDVIKIDVEGAELHVLKGARKLLEENKPRILLEMRRNSSAILKYLIELGYHPEIREGHIRYEGGLVLFEKQ